MNLPAWARWSLGGITAGLAASQALVPMGELAHACVSLALVVFAALGIVPPHYEIDDEK